MAYLQYDLVVIHPRGNQEKRTGARVTDVRQLGAIIEAIHRGCFGHYSRSCFFLILRNGSKMTQLSADQLARYSRVQLFPNGGHFVDERLWDDASAGMFLHSGHPDQKR